jgi:hypothetical protein
VHFHPTQVGPLGSSDLLQLPVEVLNSVLQQLDLCSLASTAASCSKLSHAVPANIVKAVIHYQPVTDCSGRLDSFTLWAERHGSHLTSLIMHMHSGPPYLQTLCELPCPNLRQLHLVDPKCSLSLRGATLECCMTAQD